MSSGRPTGAERSGGAPWGQGTAGNPGISCMSTTPAAPWAGGRAAPRAYAGQRGAYMVWSTRRERRAGQGLPSRAPTHTCQNRDFGPRQLAFPVPGGGGAGGTTWGAPRACAGQRGEDMVWKGRPAGGERGESGPGGRGPPSRVPARGCQSRDLGARGALHSPGARGLAARAGRTPDISVGQQGEARAFKGGPAGGGLPGGGAVLRRL